MPVQTLQIEAETHAKLQELATQAGLPVPVVLEEAIEAYRRQRFLLAANAAYARLRDDPVAWAQEQAERGEWDATLADGLQDE